MDKKRLINVNIESHALVPPPSELQRMLPAPEASLSAVHAGRAAIRAILDGDDRRLLLIVGPCSIHDTDAALDYARRLKALSDKVKERCLIAMRVYFEKPRTTVGWKGLINDPFLNDSFHIEEGLKKARKLLIDITRLGLAAATEVLDPIAPQYLSELVSWYAVGARTIESQTHREI
ncbi:MAG: 3-deoxy-7-phosphoheptulonate synthase, partial [Elusimicrobiota bacterium]